MKRTVVAIFCILLLTCFATAQRLPEGTAPESYKLMFSPDFTNNTFMGEETIQVRLLKPTSQIVLNALELDLQQVSITDGQGMQKAKVALDKQKETATLTADNSIPAGPATIHIHYVGILNDELRGFYRGKDEQGRKYAATQFEATDARRAFPCFDEPAYKASFDITVVADKDLTVISNSKVVSDTPDPTGEKHTVHFATTPKMSSYLVALVVGQFESLEGSADGIPIRVYTSPGKKELGSFALAAAESFIPYFDRYFGIKYPYGKLDMIGLADFSAGAMENTGCITSRELLLLLDEKSASLDLKKYVAVVIAHEIAHQWFGDLVTMQWWDDVWLNEGFATWASSKPVMAWKPEWNIQLDDTIAMGQALNADSLLNTHPIHQQAQTPAQILELADSITYDKTASILRMLESYVGPDTFRAGVNVYLRQHAFGNATAADFWNTQAQVSRQPVDKIMAGFVEQPGPPFVSLQARCVGNQVRVSLRQQRYFFDRTRFINGSKEVWQIPVCLKPDSASPHAEQQCELLTRQQRSVTLQGCSPWVYGNADARGFYHSGYQSEAVRAMANSVEAALTPAERILLLSDVWAAMRVGHEPIGDYLALAEGLQGERTTAVLDQLFPQLDYIGRYLVSASDRPAYEDWLRQLLTPMAKEVGWQVKPSKSPEQTALRSRLLDVLGRVAHDPEVVELAHKLANQALGDPSSVDHETAFEALRIAAIDGDAGLYDKIMARWKAAKTPEEFYGYQSALASFSDPALLQRTLDYALSPQERSQDRLLLIGRVMRNPAGQKLTWDFVRSHWENIASLTSAFGGGGETIVSATGTFCDAGMRDQVKDFFSTHPAPERALKQAQERANYCVDLRERQGAQLATWLLQRHGSAGSTNSNGMANP